MSKIEVVKRGRSVRVHPQLADVLVARGGYLRRDMVAQAPASPPPQSHDSSVLDLDIAGTTWDPDLHTADKAKTKAGAWRKRPQPKNPSAGE